LRDEPGADHTRGRRSADRGLVVGEHGPFLVDPAAKPGGSGAGNDVGLAAAAGTGGPGAASARADRGPPRSGRCRRGRADWCRRGRRARRCRWTSHSRPTSAGTGPRRSTAPRDVSQPSRHAPACR
jgi:hypothetical protein